MPAKKIASFGSKVAVNLEGKHQNGTIFDTTENDVPFIFTVGEEDVPDGFSKAVDGLSEGDVVTIVMTPEDGYGYRDEELVFEVSRDFLDGDEPVIGNIYEADLPGVGLVELTIVQVLERTVVIDLNSPLAGKTVVYKIELLKIY
jgi:FKBP-type peptidyl-prolyl cis-trans isomerase 2